MIAVYVFAVLFIADSMQATYLPCKSGPVPASVSIVGCSSVPCNLVRGTNVEGRINFKAGKQSSKLCLKYGQKDNYNKHIEPTYIHVLSQIGQF